jgi:hypothetical protein
VLEALESRLHKVVVAASLPRRVGDDVFIRNDVACTGVGDEAREQHNGEVAALALEEAQPLIQEVLEQPLDTSGFQQRGGIVRLPESAADHLKLGEVQPPATSALRQRAGDAIGDPHGELAAVRAREALERRTDDLLRAVNRWRHQADALIDEVGLLCQQRFEAREVVLTEGEEHLDAETTASQETDDRVDDLRLRVLSVVEQGYELLELVED